MGYNTSVMTPGLAFCVVCNKQFAKYRKDHRFCSRECKQVEVRRRAPRRHLAGEAKVPTGTAGAISELLIATDLLSKGYHVFRSLSPSCFCDLVAYKGAEHHFVEVRSGFLGSSGALTFNKVLHGPATLFGVVVRNDGNRVVYLSLDSQPLTL